MCTLRTWMLLILPAWALIFVFLCKPTTWMVVGLQALPWALSGVGIIYGETRPSNVRAACQHFAVTTVICWLWIPSVLDGRQSDEWDALSGPGVSEPGWFRVHPVGEVSVLLALPWVSVGMGVLVGWTSVLQRRFSGGCKGVVWEREVKQSVLECGEPRSRVGKDGVGPVGKRVDGLVKQWVDTCR